MDTYENNLKRSTMYIYKLMLKSNITHSPDGNQLTVLSPRMKSTSSFISQYTADSCRVHLGHEIRRPSDTHAEMNCHACAVLDRSLVCVCRSRDMSHARMSSM